MWYDMYMIENRFAAMLANIELKNRQRISNRQIAIAAGVSEPVVARWRAGDVSVYHANVLEAFCQYLDCQPGDLLVYVPSHDNSQST